MQSALLRATRGRQDMCGGTTTIVSVECGGWARLQGTEAPKATGRGVWRELGGHTRELCGTMPRFTRCGQGGGRGEERVCAERLGQPLGCEAATQNY